MTEEVACGKSLEEIEEEYCRAWGCDKCDLNIEVLKKPGIIRRQWKVKVSLKEQARDSLDNTTESQSIPGEPCNVTFVAEENKFIIQLNDNITFVEPYLEAGKVLLNGKEQENSFKVQPEDKIEFYPRQYDGELTWDILIEEQGMRVIARVKAEKPGRFSLPEKILAGRSLKFKEVVQWQDMPYKGNCWDEGKFKSDLNQKGIVHGIESSAWKKVQEVEGMQDVIIAEGTLPVPPVQPKVEYLLGKADKKEDIDEAKRVDFYASKVKTVKEGDVIARLIPGKPGIPGKSVLGREIPCPPLKKLEFKLMKNVHLSEDGLQVIASKEGLPVRWNEFTYGVENVLVVEKDVDLSTGSIEFPENVIINGNVQDGMHVFSGGEVNVGGSVFNAEVRAGRGLVINRNAIGSKIIVGEGIVIQTKLLRLLREINDSLTKCLLQTEEILKASQGKNHKPGQILKLIIEQKHALLPKKAIEAEKFMAGTKDVFFTKEIVFAVKRAKQYLYGLGPLNKDSIPMLKNANRVIGQFVKDKSWDIPEELNCSIDYIQGATIECAGSLECTKGVYNSTLSVEGDVKIKGVYRGGTIVSRGNVEVKELGGVGITTTVVQIFGSNRLKADFCHPQVKIILDKEIVQIDEPYRSLEVYREEGRVQVDRLRWHKD